jgi:hypothetical protein
MKCDNCGKERELTRQMIWRINKGLSKNLCLDCSNKSKQKKDKLKVTMKGMNTMENNGMWKGDEVKLNALHNWVKRRKPKPVLCEDCNKTEPYDLSNISGEYKRDTKDFKWICRSCHMKEDGRLSNLNQYNDLPVEEIIPMMEDLINKGFTCYIKWLCEGCGERVTSDTPNSFFTEGYTCEECGETSYPTKYGLLVIWSNLKTGGNNGTS